MPELERYILHRLWEIDSEIQKCVKNYDFHQMFITLLNFCSNDLSAFYFDIRKDSIYCDSEKSEKRRSARSLLDIILIIFDIPSGPNLSIILISPFSQKKDPINFVGFIII